MVNFKKVFKQIRKDAGLSQAAFGAKLGIGTQFVSNIERGVGMLPVRYFKKAEKFMTYEQVEALRTAYILDAVEIAKTRATRKLYKKGKCDV